MTCSSGIGKNGKIKTDCAKVDDSLKTGCEEVHNDDQTKMMACYCDTDMCNARGEKFHFKNSHTAYRRLTEFGQG